MESNENNPRENNFKKALAQFFAMLIILIIFITISLLALKFVSAPDKTKIEPIVQQIVKDREVVLQKPDCDHSMAAFEELRDKGQYVRLVIDTPSYGVNGHFVSNIEPTVFIEGADDVACGFLYVRLSKAGKKLNEETETVYINPHEFGGHILLNRNISSSSGPEKPTEVLLPLNSISYLEGLPYRPLEQNYRIANWVNLLNVNSHVKFGIGLSTLDQGGKIEEISIAYKCWNPTTGKEGSNCQLGLK